MCRHRAYTVTKREAGSSLVLGCRYHGWSYNAFGNLIKAPHFDNVAGFEKSQNGLFEINTQVSDEGFVFANMQAQEEVLPGDFHGLDEFVRKACSKGSVKWVGGQATEGAFNWKFACKYSISRFIHLPQCLSSCSDIKTIPRDHRIR